MFSRTFFMWLLVALWMLSARWVSGQELESADIAAFQLGVVAEATPGSDITYTITVTNYGPVAVDSFYLVDGWTVNDEGIAGFAAPIPDPNFGDFTVTGTWEQDRPDQKVFAWLLDGALLPGDTVQFDWAVQINNAYEGGLVNWARVIVEGVPDGVWQPRTATSAPTPPTVAGATDPDAENNRTIDGVTVVTDTPTGQGLDLAVYQTGILSTIPAGEPLSSIWLVANLGPQPVEQFYLVAGWSLNVDGGSILAQPVTEPDFGDFQVMGSWRLTREDEELWMWLLDGELLPGASAEFAWTRQLIPTYRGDLIHWARVYTQFAPEGEWFAREGTSLLPHTLTNVPDAVPDNDRSTDNLTTVIE